MANFFAELKRRHIYRVAAAYAVVAWVLLQLIANVAPILELPPWVARAFLLLLVIGFPLAILLAWTREPEGDPTQRAMTGRLDWALMGALVVVIALVSYQQLAPMSETTPASQTPGIETAREAATSPAGAISIAVLPFANLSGDANQEFFSDGMTEEIITALARIPDLRVVARGSASQFKGERRDMRAVGQALGATHLLEGSVRRAGTRLRITAQLVRAEDGVNAWVSSYDRELTDVFAIQEDIATAIAGALRVPLGLQPGETLIFNRTDDLNSYEQYLRARALYRARTPDAAIQILEPLVVRDPGFAPAWGLLAQVYVQADFWDKAERAAREAIRLDPRNASAYAALGDAGSHFGRWSDGENAFRRALLLDPNEPDILHRYSTRLGVAGRTKEALALKEKLNTLEPFVPLYNANIARFMVSAGQTQTAIAILEKIPAEVSFVGDIRNVTLARAYAMEGRYAEAADTLLAVRGRGSMEDAAQLLRSAPRRAGSPETLPALEGRLNFVYAHVGALDRVLENPERAVAMQLSLDANLDALWTPETAPLRKTERFKKFVRDSGLYDYWRERGWADGCRPVGTNDFVCD